MSINITDIAKKLDTSPANVSRWFNGKRQIPKDMALKFEHHYGVDRRSWYWPAEYANPFLKSDQNQEDQTQRSD